MRTKVYIVLEDFDNGLEYEDSISWNERFVGIAQTKDEAREIIMKSIDKYQHIECDEGDTIVVLQHFRELYVEKTTYYIREYELRSESVFNKSNGTWTTKHEATLVH